MAIRKHQWKVYWLTILPYIAHKRRYALLSSRTVAGASRTRNSSLSTKYSALRVWSVYGQALLVFELGRSLLFLRCPVGDLSDVGTARRIGRQGYSQRLIEESMGSRMELRRVYLQDMLQHVGAVPSKTFWVTIMDRRERLEIQDRSPSTICIDTARICLGQPTSPWI